MTTAPQSGRLTRQPLIIVGLLGLALVVPLLDRNAYHLEVLVSAWLFALLAVGLNLIVGFAGLLHLGYAAFFAIGAYTYGFLNLYAGWGFWASLPAGMAAAGLLGVVLGLPALRVRGDYLAIVTLGFGEIVRLAFTNLDRWTGGPNGLLGIAHPTVPVVGWEGGALHVAWWNFGVRSAPYYYLALGWLLIVLWACRGLAGSRVGRAWVAIREDELAAQCMGLRVTALKLTALGIGCGVAGLAGCLFAAKQGTITPDGFDFMLSVMVLAMVVLGGLGSLEGGIAGAVLLTVLPELLRGMAQYRMLAFGAVMIIMMRVRPQGLWGARSIRAELLGGRSQPSGEVG